MNKTIKWRTCEGKIFLNTVYVIFEIIWCDLSLAECIERSRLKIKFDACPCDPNCK